EKEFGSNTGFSDAPRRGPHNNVRRVTPRSTIARPLQVRLLRCLVVLHIPAQTTNFHERQGSRNGYARSKQKKHAPFSHHLPRFLLVSGEALLCSARDRAAKS